MMPIRMMLMKRRRRTMRRAALDSSDAGQPRLDIWADPKGELRIGSLAVRVAGEGRPTLLLHGFMGSNRYWGAAYDRLADDGLLLAPDLLGFGFSRGPDRGYGPDDHGDALVRSVAELGVGSDLLVVGHSTGALLSLWLASRYPDKVRRVVAIAPPLFRDPEHARRQIRQLGRLEQLFAFQDWAAKIFCRHLCQKRPKLAARLYGVIRPDLPEPILEDATRHSWTSYSETIKRVIVAAEAAQWLASATCDVELVAGTDDRMLDLDFLRELSGQHPHVTLRIIPDGDHHLPLTQPELCLAAIAGEPNSMQTETAV
ncbi:alpha/beta fold hydrolase [Microlunatus sp. Gsoil 973]|uniref:alpha/beta fold hydrolase n=1 Tax=Microlunatus sp. Gsoil 973 TaxID=2672569 RepID=UPI0012B4440D|nr:alpha/beta hydrolase [Microlunatus sp. Gsoil 973]QGN32501.1 alpha/beta fold hydrolase [Microlunatus sp. Gsoil 973]